MPCPASSYIIHVGLKWDRDAGKRSARLPEGVILKQDLSLESRPKWRNFDPGWNMDRVLTAPIIKAYNITRGIIIREDFSSRRTS